MSDAAGRRDQVVAQSVAMARDIAPDLDSILFNLYPDADTLDTFQPGETDLATVVAVNRAVAAELAACGVRVFVQRADRASFRRWMDGRADTPENRWAWRDRAHLLRGAAALEALGVDPGLASPRPKLGKAPGPLADRLIATFADEDQEDSEFEDLADDLLAAGRNDVLDLAVRKVADRLGDEVAENLIAELLQAAEGAEIGPSGWAELVALPVALPPRDVPDAAGLCESLLAADVLPPTVEIRFLPGWRSPDALARLDPVAVRRALVDIVAGVEPRDMPVADTDDLAEAGFGVLLGVQTDWSVRLWEEVAANGPPLVLPEGEETPEDVLRTAAFDRWRAAAFATGGGCVPLALVPPSEVQDEIADFLAEAGQQVSGIEDIREFVAMTRRESPGEEVVCRPEFVGGGLELAIYTRAGRLVDCLSLSADRMPARAEEILQMLSAIVPLVKDIPGR
jgi:hypothetical protein